MTAQELAVELDAASSEMEYNYVVNDWKLLSDSAEMLRQQALEITGLKLEWQVWYDMNLALRDRIAQLESQVYGGTTQ